MERAPCARSCPVFGTAGTRPAGSGLMARTVRFGRFQRPNVAILAVTAVTLDQTVPGDPGFAGIPRNVRNPAEPALPGRFRPRWPTISTHPAPSPRKGVHGNQEVPSPLQYGMLFAGIQETRFGRNRSMKPRGFEPGFRFPTPWLWPVRAITGHNGHYGQNPRSNHTWVTETARYDVPVGRRNGACAPFRDPRG